MPSIPLFPRSQDPLSNGYADGLLPLPSILQTPAGLAVLEVQGTINIPSVSANPLAVEDEETRPVTETPVGSLVFPLYSKDSDPGNKAWMKQVYLYIGKHQRMTGEVKQLAKPYAIIRRRGNFRTSEQVLAGAEGQEELEIAEIIKFKLVFTSRPEPVGGEQTAA